MDTKLLKYVDRMKSLMGEIEQYCKSQRVKDTDDASAKTPADGETRKRPVMQLDDPPTPVDEETEERWEQDEGDVEDDDSDSEDEDELEEVGLDDMDDEFGCDDSEDDEEEEGEGETDSDENATEDTDDDAAEEDDGDAEEPREQRYKFPRDFSKAQRDALSSREFKILTKVSQADEYGMLIETMLKNDFKDVTEATFRSSLRKLTDCGALLGRSRPKWYTIASPKKFDIKALRLWSPSKGVAKK